MDSPTDWRRVTYRRTWPPWPHQVVDVYFGDDQVRPRGRLPGIGQNIFIPVGPERIRRVRRSALNFPLGVITPASRNSATMLISPDPHMPLG